MAIILNDNLKINAGKPIDSRYLTTGNTTYASTGATNSAIPIPLRYTGLTVNILGTEYWYKTGVVDINLIQKKYDTVLPTGSFVTGATNIGYFSGHTSVQTLPITNLPDNNYNGNYYSLYNYYYRGIDGKIHVGVPSDGILKRGYVKTASPVKSWLWNEYTGSSNRLGWILIDGDISQQIGSFENGYIYYTGSSQVYTESGWITGNVYSNSSSLVISTVLGSLTSGTTLIIGGPFFATKTNNALNFRTLITKTPTLLSVSYDEAFVYISGNTGSALITASNGLTKIGQDVRLGGTLISGTTIITDSRATPVGIQYAADYSASFTDRSLIDKGYLTSISALGGERIFKTIYQTSHGFSIGQVVGWSGCTYNLPIATGLYDGEVIGIVTNCFNPNSFEVTQAGFVSGITVGGGLITNCTYFLSATVAGCLTTCEPITPNYLSKSMLIATSACSGWVLPYAGYVITSGITQGGALIRNVCNISASPYVVTPSDFYIGAKGGDIVQLNSLHVNGQVIVVDDVCGNAAIGCEIQVSGVFFGGSSTACINTAYGSMTFIYNGGKACWSAIGFSTAPY
jgi:hypothetical protein